SGVRARALGDRSRVDGRGAAVVLEVVVRPRGRACGSGRLGSRDWLSDARCVLLGAAFHGALRAGWYLHRSVVAREGSGSDALSDHPPVCAVSWISQARDPGEGIERVGA